MTSIRLHYSDALVRRAVKAFWWRIVGWRFLIALTLVAISFTSLVLAGDRSWLVGFLGAVLALGMGFIAALYVVHHRGSLGRFRRMSLPEATLELGDATFRITSDAGMAEVPWKQVGEIWRFGEFWLVLLSPANFFTLPMGDLKDEAREWILERVKAHGGRVV
jgi:hypothetical protein